MSPRKRRARWPSPPDRERRAVTPIPDPFPRLYAILDFDAATGRAIPAADLLDAWLSSGVTLIQLRAKHLTFGPFLDVAAPMAERCREAGATFLVNDRADVAVLSGAHGVHVGQDDLPVEAVRRLIGEGVVGVSTHTRDQVQAAMQTTADYLAIGPVFATGSKGRDAGPVVGVSGVQDAAQTIASGTPLVAIGGITLDLASSVIQAGASSVAVISDLLAPDWRTRARDYLRVLCL